MRRLSVFTLAVTLGAALTPLAAQDAFGTWQGTLATAAKPLRLVIDIEKDNGRVKVVQFSIDQSGFQSPVTADTVATSSRTLRIAFTRVRATFDGTLNVRGDTITGTWAQGGPPRPLVLVRATSQTEWRDSSSHSIRHVAVDTNVSLEVLDWGGRGRPVVLLAGAGNTAHVFDQFAAKLVGRYHVLGITRRGFGRSSAPLAGYSADRLGDDVLAVLDSLRLAKPVLIGHSIAGEELSSIGSRHAQRVAGLVYLDAGYAYAYYDSAQQNTLINMYDVQRKLARLSPALSPRALEDILNDLLTTSLPLMERDMRVWARDLAARPNRDVTPPPFARDFVADSLFAGEQKFTAIRGPVLAIFAAPREPSAALLKDSVALAKSDSAYLAAVMPQISAFERGTPGARVVRIPHSNHYVFRSHETDVLREVVAFIDSLR
ncbi:MAG TPA: alpha/beta hydrolase [Gemmatimonadaceae bacterium]|jgi:pimeloyl-ACP methyl ester carboxylesterase|nr:alpha/beta hydrolase [Gemmatimonadaceae bacterium]